jgi:hypothetical protein
MNSVWTILFVVIATIIGKWLLFDDDKRKSDPVSTDLAEPPSESNESPLSKSA